MTGFPDMLRSRFERGVGGNMRLAGIAIVRNECDIVEAFVRHNTTVLDRLYIVDNHSSDATPEILQRLAANGLPIKLGTDENLRYYQAVKTAALIKTALLDEPWDCLFLLDGDEFVLADDRSRLEAEIASLGPEQVGVLVCDHYAPMGSDDAAEPDPVRRIIHRAAAEPPMPQYFGKAIVPYALASSPDVAIGEGNHHIRVGGRQMPERWLASARIAHFPVRSVEQFVSKVVTTRLAWLSRRDYQPSLGHHIAILFAQLRDQLEITSGDLLDAVFVYLDDYLGLQQRSYERKLIRDPVHRRGGPLHYPDLIGISMLPRILHFAEQLARQLGQASVLQPAPPDVQP
jgi:glycosyltransferase involved in cell wall biosynthesis